MKTALHCMFVILLATGLAQLSPAQMHMGMGAHPPEIAGVFNPNVGSGSSYEIVKKGGEKTTFDIAAVDKESGGYWIEYGVNHAQMQGPVYMKTLMARQGDDVVIQRTIVQMPGHPPMEMTSMMSMKGMQNQKEKADYRADAEDLGTETITTPAGTFFCQHWRSKKDGSEVWLADKVSPWKLVKYNGPNDTMTLVRLITDAKTHITEKPVSMEEMMKQHMGQ